MGIPLQGLIHDLSKLLPDEWFPYANHFYGPKPPKGMGDHGYCKPAQTGDDWFDLAWLKHQHRNPHHWQYWLLRKDNGSLLPLEMPTNIVWEMVCDWRGAGKAQGKTGPNECRDWYLANRHKMQLHESTRSLVERILEVRT
jgi:hypothetical protein